MCGRLSSFHDDACLLGELERTDPPPWEAEVQDFTAGGIAVSSVVVLTPDGAMPAGGRSVFAPLLVAVLDENAYAVAPGLRDVLEDDTRDGCGAVWITRHDAIGGWAVLDGPDPMVKLSVRITKPTRIHAELIFPTASVKDLVHFVGSNSAVGLIAARCVPPLPVHQPLNSTLEKIFLVPTLPSAALLALADARGWPHEADDAADRDD